MVECFLAKEVVGGSSPLRRSKVGYMSVPVPHRASGSSNGRTTAFGAVNLRSNRSPEALCGITYTSPVG